MSYFDSKLLRAAKALSAKDWSHPKIIQAARHMAHDGATTRDIHETFWPDAKYQTVVHRLKRFNIRCRNKYNRARYGELTTLSCNNADIRGIDQRDYKPREVRQ